MLKKSDALRNGNEARDNACRITPKTPMFATAVILAGGASRRMGFDKQTLTLGDRPLIERTVEQLGVLFDDIVIVTDRPQLYRDYNVRVMADVFSESGPMAGIHAGLLQAKSRFVYVIGCDMPYPDRDYINLMLRMLENTKSDSVVGCMMQRDDGRLEPLNAFYSTELAEDMAKSLDDGERSLQFFCRHQPFLWITEEEGRAISPELRMFRNINDFADLLDIRGCSALSMPDRSAHVRPVRISRVTWSGEARCEDYVVQEGCLSLVVNGEEVSEIHALPERWRDLAVGWLYARGLISTADDVRSFQVEPIAGRADAFEARIVLGQIERSIEHQPIDHCSSYAVLTASANSMTETTVVRDPSYMVPYGTPPFSLDVVGKIMGHLDGETSLFRETGGTHSMIMFNLENYDVTDVCEDTSRHACLDKLIGHALLERRDLLHEGLATSCRVTTTIMQKIVRAGIPVVISRTATTTAAVQLARKAGITMICFARGRRYNLMT